MLKKVIIPFAILLLAVIGFRYMTADSAPKRPNRGNTEVASQTTGQGEKPQRDQQTKGDGEQRPQQAQSSEGNDTKDQPKAEDEQKVEERSQTQQGRNNPRGGGLRSGVLAKQGATSVEVMPAQAKASTAHIELFGLIEAQQYATLTASSQANISEITTSEGSFVKAGERIAQLSGDNALESLTQRQFALQELEARTRNDALKYENDLLSLEIDQELLRIAKNSVDRFTSLNEQQLSSSNDYESALRTYQSQLLSVQNRQLTIAQYQDQLTQSKSQKASLESQIRQAKETVDNLDVVMPFDGLIAKLPFTNGQELRSGDVVADVYNPDSIVLYVRVPLRYRLDQLDLESIVAKDTEGNDWIANAIRPINESGAQRLTLAPQDTDYNLPLPGSHVSLSVMYPLSVSAIEVPVTAVYDQQRVYLFNRGTIEALDVQIIGQTVDGYLLNPEPFKGRAMIVTTRMKKPISGMAVTVARGGNGEGARR
jgi:hypothetical protein